ncbi:MAG TPA: hypothetical protein VIY48_16870 [Candidatus Paceibacterota bacterium]
MLRKHLCWLFGHVPMQYNKQGSVYTMIIPRCAICHKVIYG